MIQTKPRITRDDSKSYLDRYNPSIPFKIYFVPGRPSETHYFLVNKKHITQHTLGMIKDRGNLTARFITIDSDSPYPQLTLAHELGHVLASGKSDILKTEQDPDYCLRIEVLAWRITKSFLPSYLWDEKQALKYLYSYIPAYWTTKKKGNFLVRFKIRELNKGVKLR
jgi:hypothetical protein